MKCKKSRGSGRERGIFRAGKCEVEEKILKYSEAERAAVFTGVFFVPRGRWRAHGGDGGNWHGQIEKPSENRVRAAIPGAFFGSGEEMVGHTGRGPRPGSHSRRPRRRSFEAREDSIAERPGRGKGARVITER